ncbi:4-alpha-glucanotransferase [Entomospira culicis]|uniref:4-alpha-glucanotransferase n=1 Tax=Entomospira culicis TaxID=2719989 RepID=A0A968GGJ1_9SPIO|nr:4-alpha-glucanotransferase [Entomospira culicis]NIZ19875.1 4-alpha-glucanotransferase [Entomospira culicis]NIZ70089.1 4-alpha-glucanotransferase [Entomospira culicis]WDI37193.1 4-alpha-glucanotransferase [Entomospira culicis]WDI38822.1 4-alpha-glucanotransferase [Entomospira culicis]
MEKKAGILMAISSLPSAYGIGDFGPRAYQFVDEISTHHLKIWQILPFNRLGYGNSPYQPHSSIAGDELFISPDLLVKEGLLTQADLSTISPHPEGVQYDATRAFKEPFLQKAFEAFQQSKSLKAEFATFAKENKWLYNYAVFMTFKKLNQMRLWLEWPQEHKNWIRDHQFDLSAHQAEIDYQQFLQFIFFKQWHQLRAYANAKGIQIMGDIPFYVGIDSIDVWENQEFFLLDEASYPTFIAGVPPDYFSATGQRWGNPLYNWQKMQENDYRFWVERLWANMQAFDIVRIDHFRAFDTYWKIPASCETAIEGEWIEGPAYHFFDAIYRQLPNLNLVAEDLGEMRPEVYTLRDHYHFAGMKIIQFTFDPHENNNDFEDRENMIIYTGTHDNQTILGWYQEQPHEVQQATDRYLEERGFTGSFSRKWVRFALSSIAKWTITPTQDLLGLDDSARMNVPGTIGAPNWQWQMQESPAWQEALANYGAWIKEYQRN